MNGVGFTKLPYVIVIAIMAIIGLLVIMVITWLRPTHDNSILIGLVLGFVTTTTVAIFAFLKSQETHLMFNSRMTEMMENVKEVARLKGEKSGRDEAESKVIVAVTQIPAVIEKKPPVKQENP